MGPLGTSFNEIWLKIQTFSFRKMRLKCRLRNGVHFVPASICYWVVSHMWSQAIALTNDNILSNGPSEVYLNDEIWYFYWRKCIENATCKIAAIFFSIIVLKETQQIKPIHGMAEMTFSNTFCEWKNIYNLIPSLREFVRNSTIDKRTGLVEMVTFNMMIFADDFPWIMYVRDSKYLTPVDQRV